MAFSDLFNWVVESKGELDSVLSVATSLSLRLST